MMSGEVEYPAFSEEIEMDSSKDYIQDQNGVKPVLFGHPLYNGRRSSMTQDCQPSIDGFPKYVIDFGISDVKMAYSELQPDISHVNFYKVRLKRVA